LDLGPNDIRDALETLDQKDQILAMAAQGRIGEAFRGKPEAKRITQLLGSSLTFDWAPYFDSFDFVFVDGGHSDECVAADSAAAVRLTRAHGLILWDDYSWLYPAVPRHLEQLLSFQ
jgi:predicted O-methyltransferase YrrM